jgi:hypothetical protein
LVLDLGVGFHGVSVVLTVVVAVEVLDLASLWCLMWCFCCSGDGLVVVVSLFLEKHLRGGDGVAALWWLEVLTWRWVIGVEVVVGGCRFWRRLLVGLEVAELPTWIRWYLSWWRWRGDLLFKVCWR